MLGWFLLMTAIVVVYGIYVGEIEVGEIFWLAIKALAWITLIGWFIFVAAH